MTRKAFLDDSDIGTENPSGVPFFEVISVLNEAFDIGKFRDKMTTMRKLLLLAMLPSLMSLLAFATPQNAPVANGGPPAVLPACGDFIRKNIYSEEQGHNDGGSCSNDKLHFKYQRTITEDIFMGGSKYYCGNWAYQNECYATCKEFAACPSKTCSAVTFTDPDPIGEATQN